MPEFAEDDYEVLHELLPPAVVEDSELFDTHPDEARKLWADGFRPRHAHDLERKMEVMYRTTMFEMPTAEYGVTMIEEVAETDYGSVMVSTWDRGLIEVDECSEVWAR